MLDSQIANVLAVVSIAGFAIQQLLQILDPMLMVAINRYKERRPNSTLPGGLSEGDFKKSLMTLLGFGMGLLVVWLTKVETLGLLNEKWKSGDFLVTALVISGGTEGFNTLLKYVGYVKDARKQALAPVVTIIPSTASVAMSSTFQFTARVDNAPQEVFWEVLNNNGGTIDSKGLYTAPPLKGTFQVVAFSPTDPSRPALAAVTVT